MPRPLKTLHIILRFLLTNHHIYIYCRLARLTGAFKNNVDLVLCIIGSDWKDIKLYVLDPMHFKRVNKLSKLNQSIYSQDHLQRTSADMELRNYTRP